MRAGNKLSKRREKSSKIEQKKKNQGQQEQQEQQLSDKELGNVSGGMWVNAPTG